MVSNVKVHDRDAIRIRLLKRLWGDQPSPKKLSNVRRNLFGFCEKVTRQKDVGYQAFDEEFKAKAKKASQEWNFDFVNGVPLPGKYVWQRMHSYDVPSWYAAVNRVMLKDACSRDEDENRSVADKNACLSKNETEIRLTGLNETEEKMEPPSCKKPRLVQTSMKDFTRVQKRRSSRRLQLKQLQVYSSRLRNHHHHHHLSPMHGRGVTTSC